MIEAFVLIRNSGPNSRLFFQLPLKKLEKLFIKNNIGVND